MNNLPFTLQELNNHIENGWVVSRRHPTEDLTIYNYSKQTEFAHHWDHITKVTRGLILDGSGNIIARPFAKFFNLEQLIESGEVQKDQVFEGYYQQKYDGWLGVVYQEPESGMWSVSSRGSFDSIGANIATKMLRDKYRNIHSILDNSWTLLVEIIHPETKIVCDYDNQEDLVALAVIDKITGRTVYHAVDLFADHMPVSFRSSTQTFSVSNLLHLKTLIPSGEEGYVIVYGEGDLRMKIKSEEYFKLHRVKNNISVKYVIDILGELDEDKWNDYIKDLPDEFMDGVNSVAEVLMNRFNEDVRQHQKIYDSISEYEKNERGLFAKKVHSQPVGISKTILFMLIDGKNFDKIVWKNIRKDLTFIDGLDKMLVSKKIIIGEA